MQELRLHSALINLNTSRLFLVIRIYQENIMKTFTKIYQSRKISKVETQDRVLLNEMIYLNSSQSTSFIKIVFTFLTKIEEDKVMKQFEFYRFLDDLIEPELVSFKLDTKEQVRFVLTLPGKTQKILERKPWIENSMDIRANILQSIKLINLFTQRITPLRRLKNDIEK